jgi:hypothetical protein
VLKFEWNGLRPGDRVLVHDALTSDLALAPGVVTRIERRRLVNGVGIRVAAGILWPTYPAVHGDPHDPDDPIEPCWRCQAPNGRR